jgi:hypothetical protein
LSLSGDLHHFAHYTANNAADGIARHKITCGGGGAFTHGTHHLPKEIDLVEQGEHREYKLDTKTKPDGSSEANVLPSQCDSKKLLGKNLAFPFHHPWFAALLGGFYLVYALVLANAGFLNRLSSVPIELTKTWIAFHFYITTTFSHLAPLVFVLLLLVSGYAFAQPDWHSNPDLKRKRKFIGGLAHALMHLAVLVPLLWVMAHCSALSLPPLPPNWSSFFGFSLAVYVFGAVGGGLVFGIYLSASNLFAGFHRTEAFSAVRDANHKSFLRIHLDNDRLVIYPLGLVETESAWKEDTEGGENHSWIQPGEKTKLVPELIGEPIELR